MQKLDEFGRPQYGIKEAAERAIEILTKYQPHGHNTTVNESIAIEVLTSALSHEISHTNN